MAERIDPLATRTAAGLQAILLEIAKHGTHAMRLSARYAQDLLDGDLREWDAKVLRGEYHPSVTVEYVLSTKDGRWPDLEAAVRDRPHEDDWSRGVVVEYASRVLGDRWMAEEERLERSARSLLEYADKVARGRLPDELHDAMERHRVLDVDPEEQRHAAEYFTKYGT
jgi:hypothetical protein